MMIAISLFEAQHFYQILNVYVNLYTICFTLNIEIFFLFFFNFKFK